MENAYGRLGITTRTSLPYEAAVESVKQALKAEGFGILTEVDVRACVRYREMAHFADENWPTSMR
jgi:uncharacterized protein (DUF302 family)